MIYLWISHLLVNQCHVWHPCGLFGLVITLWLKQWAKRDQHISTRAHQSGHCNTHIAHANVILDLANNICVCSLCCSKDMVCERTFIISMERLQTLHCIWISKHPINEFGPQLPSMQQFPFLAQQHSPFWILVPPSPRWHYAAQEYEQPSLHETCWLLTSHLWRNRLHSENAITRAKIRLRFWNCTQWSRWNQCQAIYSP